MAITAWTIAACGGTPAVPEDKAPAKAKAPVAEKAKPEPPKPVVPTEPTRALPKTLPLDQAEAKAAEIHAAHRQSFFCGCSYTPQMRTIRQSCGYKTRADDSLAHDIVWTHVVAPDAFGAHRTCWTTEACRRDDGTSFGGIECCRKQDPVFAAMEADLHNVVPAIAEVVKDRSDYPFGDIKGEERMYGACDLEVRATPPLVEPPVRIRGDIARVYLYMRAVYGDELKVAADQWALFEAWNVEDPADAWEQQRAAAVLEIQGVAHPLLGGAAGPPAVPAAPGAPPAAPSAPPAAPSAPPAAPAAPPTAPGAPAPAGDAKAPVGDAKAVPVPAATSGTKTG